MFPDWNAARKRGREDEPDEYENGTGFSEHRTKRRIAALPHRTSPSNNRHATPPTFTFNTNYSVQPAPPTITPAESESEDTPVEAKSFFSPYSSSPAGVPSQISSPWMPVSQSSQMSYTDDCEMEDNVHLSPVASPSVIGRIPTPIHSAFAPYIRAEKATLNHEDNFADDEALVDRFRRGRRLPSPISEGEMSPSVLADGLGDMQMEVDRSSLYGTPTKKGHQRSKHSLRQWSGVGGDLQSAGQGMKRSFSMGYRADCEKCRNQVPGHFSHIITY